ncbi:hypothetical protein C8Q80DRAFT_1139888 [Daedaleopsis nitida]|nr:hypothetical protein C8Q80DRAFT_1139888 [Daedaleopsis nitida]
MSPLSPGPVCYACLPPSSSCLPLRHPSPVPASPAMLSLSQIYDTLVLHPDVFHNTSLGTAIAFVRLASQLRPAIIHSQPPSYDPSHVPQQLDLDICTYIAEKLAIRTSHVDALWDALKIMVWVEGAISLDCTFTGHTLGAPEQKTALATLMLYPPTVICDRPFCPNPRVLRDKDPHKAVTVFTLDKGVQQGFCVKLYCNACNTSYRHDYAVHQDVRTYYSGFPQYVEVALSTYVELRLLKLFTTLSLLSWTSATNAAHVYHEALSLLTGKDRFKASFRLRPEHVWDGFTALALLRDADDRSYALTVPHTGEQKSRFKEAMDARNTFMRCAGQPEFNHWCERCHREYQEPDGTMMYVDALVTDGIEIGRPCCSVPNCTIALASTQDRYCPGHAQYALLCVVELCNSPAQEGYKTCPHPTHRALEDHYDLQHKAQFHLRDCLRRDHAGQASDAISPSASHDLVVELDVLTATLAGSTLVSSNCDAATPDAATPTIPAPHPPMFAVHPSTSSIPVPHASSTPGPSHASMSSVPASLAGSALALSNCDTATLVSVSSGSDATMPSMSSTPVLSHPSTSSTPASASPTPAPGLSASCPEKSEMGNHRVRASFGRKHTHNEQLFVRPCGMIPARETCHTSESLRIIREFFHKYFPDPKYMPRFLIYDNGCRLYQHLEKHKDPVLNNVAFPVDVFHWKCKHKKNDDACSIHCNPYTFPELIGKDGEGWFFNSSVAEQTNVWFGGFHAIVREMSATRFDFFLDEMIKQRNWLTRASLEANNVVLGNRPIHLFSTSS